jgi:hypothetical protein
VRKVGLCVVEGHLSVPTWALSIPNDFPFPKKGKLSHRPQPHKQVTDLGLKPWLTGSTLEFFFFFFCSTGA